MEQSPTIAPIPVLFVASVVYMIAASTVCTDNSDCSGSNGYAVAVGVISLVITGVLLGMKIAGRSESLVNLHQPLSIFLFVWWAAGAGVGTFKGPFSSTGYLNGYFSAWAAFLASLKYAYNVSDRFRDLADRGVEAMKGADPSLNDHGPQGETV